MRKILLLAFLFSSILMKGQKPPLDHYLKAAPMPFWMKYGLSQVDKGKKDGYNLIDE